VDCGAISKEVFNTLANPAKYGMNMSWNCDSCQASALRLEERMNALEGRFQDVEARVVRSEGTMQETVKRMDSVETRQARVEQSLEQERERSRSRSREIRKKVL
jgi:hypothetical protein